MKESECHQLWMSAISCLLRLFHGIFILASILWHHSLFTSQIEWNKKLSVLASQNPLVLPVPPCQAHLGIIFSFPFYWLKITGGFILQHEVSWPSIQCGFPWLRNHQGTFCGTDSSWFSSHIDSKWPILGVFTWILDLQFPIRYVIDSLTPSGCSKPVFPSS